ncbi:MAG: DUF4087 domain-containing protein [bacterium]
MKKVGIVSAISFLMATAVFTAGKPAEAESGAPAFENRCGWVSNPTPANWFLDDRDGEWIIGVQGGHQAEGDVPEFPESGKYWRKTNVGSYGYGCGCLQVRVDRKEKKVLEVKGGKSLPLSKCRADKTLKPESSFR